MRVLVTWGSDHGATAEIAAEIARTLDEHGHEVFAVTVHDAPAPRGFDAAVIGGALYANRWHAPVRHYAERHLHQLRRIPTWLFSTGEAERAPHDVRGLIARIGALDHVLFGDEERLRVRAWADEIARELPTARPAPAEEPHGHALHRIVEYGAAGWAICAIAMGLVLATRSMSAALAAQAIAAPIVFGLLAHRYQAADGARSPLVTAITWTAIAGILDALLVTQFLGHAYVLGLVLPLALTFAASLSIGSFATLAVQEPLSRSTT